MIENGIADPTLVTEAVIKSAGSIAALALTTETLIADEEEEKPVPAAPDMGGMEEWVVWEE